MKIIFSFLLLSVSFVAQAQDVRSHGISLKLDEGISTRSITYQVSLPFDESADNPDSDEIRECKGSVTIPKFIADDSVVLPKSLQRLTNHWKDKWTEMQGLFDEIGPDICKDLGSARIYDIDYQFAGQFGQLVSIYYSESSFDGGAHGNYGMWSELIDLKTGGLVENKLANFLKTTESSKKRILTLIKNELDKGELFDPTFGWNDWKASFDFEQVDNFYFTKDGITFFWNPYELGPYAAGYYEASLTWQQLAGLQGDSPYAKLLPIPQLAK